MDPFVLLGLPKRPLLSEEEIGTAYRRFAGELHPDQAGGDSVRFKKLGEAAAILRDPSRRIRFLIQQSAGSAIPPEAADLFPRVATLTHQADDLLARHATASNPLSKAVLAAPLRTLSADLDHLLSELRVWRTSLDARLVELDASWPAHEAEAMAALADSYSYAIRWESQLRERKLSLDCL